MEKDPINWGSDDGPDPVEHAPAESEEEHAEPPPAAANPPDDAPPPDPRGSETSAEPPPKGAPVRFDVEGAQKLGIVGGKGVGKSYLFQAMVYRTFSAEHSGALTQHLDLESVRIFEAKGQERSADDVDRMALVANYEQWVPLAQTKLATQQWYRLRLPFRRGWLGRDRAALDVEFFDGSGEGFEAVRGPADEENWDRAYKDARVMVFCLPLWAAFPDVGLTDPDWEERERLLIGFERVKNNYLRMRDRLKQTHPVTTILALTMADDPRGALRTLRDRWITPFLELPAKHLEQLRNGSAIARYLSNARKVSEAMREEFARVQDVKVAGIPASITIGGVRPWIIPLSAIDGARLERMKDLALDNPVRKREARRGAPTPVHVELPLLVALCDRENALM